MRFSFWPAPSQPFEDVLELARTYNVQTIPVVDEERHVIGRITFEELQEIVRDEAALHAVEGGELLALGGAADHDASFGEEIEIDAGVSQSLGHGIRRPAGSRRDAGWRLRCSTSIRSQ